jgi:hypothetical protein
MKRYEKERIFNALLSENDIIILQNKFLTNGMHHIYVENVSAGRTIMKKILPLCHWYTTPVYIATPSATSDTSVTNIYDLLKQEGLLDTHNTFTSEELLDDFLYTHLSIDFMWIELTPRLVLTQWFSVIYQKIVGLHSKAHMPIIMMEYC